MNVNSVTAQSLALAQLNSQNSQTQNTGAAGIPGAIPDGSDLSNPAQFFSELEQLSQQNPSAFESITAQIGKQLSTAAANTADPNQAAFLNNLAANFQTASQTGNFSSLFPQSQGQGAPQAQSPAVHHHGHHDHGYTPQSGSTGDSNTQDVLSGIFSGYTQQVESLLTPGSTPTVNS
jgi:hypothetical protein